MSMCGEKVEYFVWTTKVICYQYSYVDSPCLVTCVRRSSDAHICDCPDGSCHLRSNSIECRVFFCFVFGFTDSKRFIVTRKWYIIALYLWNLSVVLEIVMIFVDISGIKFEFILYLLIFGVGLFTIFLFVYYHLLHLFAVISLISNYLTIFIVILLSLF